MSGQQLINAARDGNLILVKQLLDQNSPINYQDKLGDTALMYAAHYGELEIIQELIKAGASLDLQDIYGRTALMYAINNNHLEIVRELLKAGSNLDLQNNYGGTASTLLTSNEIKNLIIKYQSIRKNIKQLQDLRFSRSTYFSIIPRDLIGLIKTELEDENFYSI